MKRIFCTLCAMTLLLCGIMTTAFAAAAPSETPQGAEGDSTASPATEGVTDMTIPTPDPVPLYPAEVRQSEENGITRIEKVYYLSSQDDPSAIPTEDFEREGKVYTLLDVLKQAQIESDTKDYTEVLTLDSDTQDVNKILAMLEPELEVQTEDGYQGVLSLDHTTITVEAAGYKSSSRTVSATRTYPNLSGADVSLIPKSITDSGRTLTLADVQWQEAATTQTDGYDMALRYTATATYTGTATSKYATGYVVTANYMGEVTRVSTDVITYTAVFSSGNSASAVGDADAAIDTPQSAPFSFDWKWLLIPLGLGTLGCAGYFGQKGYKHYINKKRGYE